MKLLSLYIDNFGKLSDYSYDFSSKMNTVYEENGWGKTTLTVFIKSMLYGLNNKQERVRYTPWKNLSSFGGFLVLEANGKEYRIVRSFNPKKASLDTFQIYDLDTNLELDKFTSNLGEKFLNLNEASFERSVFIPQKDLDEGFGSDIEAKLANLIGGTNDSQSFDDAVEILKTKAKELRLNSKKGLILDKKKELSHIDDEILDCSNKMDGISIIQNNIDDINKEISKLTEDKKFVNNKIINYTREQEKKTKIAVAKKYEEDIENTRRQLDQNNEIFNGYPLTVEEVMAVRAKNKELLHLKTQYDFIKKDTRVENRLEQLQKTINFNDGLPSDEKINKIVKSVEKYNNIKSVIAAHNDEPEKKKPIGGILLTIFSTIILAVGIVLLVLSSTYDLEYLIPGAVVAGVAILGYISSVPLFILTGAHNNTVNIGRVKSYDFELRSLEEEIREFFGKYHLYSSDFNNNLYIVRSNIARYKEAISEYNDINNENTTLANKINELEKYVLSFISRFNTTAITVEEKIGELNTRLRKKAEIEAQLVNKETILKQFMTLHNLDKVNEEEVNIDSLKQLIDSIDEKIAELNNNKTSYSNKITEYEAEIAKYDELLGKKELLEKEIIKLEDEYRILNLSIDYLTVSQNSLLEKYVKPMKDSVNKYVSLLLKNNKDYSIDVNFKFQFITNNGLKGLDLYSRGYQTIISLCMRLALIDCLYPNEKPFVILDDPFVNFDDEKLELCKNLILDISNQYQIVYFTCHDSRKIR